MRGVIAQTDIEISTSPTYSFLVGASIFAPLFVYKNNPFEGFLGDVLLSIAIIVYVVLMVIFVFGPMRWEKYRFYPNDGMEKAAIRMVCWVIGGAGSMAFMEYTNAL